MNEKPMTQIIRELISANFPIEIVGLAGPRSQFGVPYITFVNGAVITDDDSSVDSASDGQINTWAMEWISTLPRDHDVAVWRVFPELHEEGDRRKVRWRLHTMTRAHLIAALDTMPSLPQTVHEVVA